MTDSPISDAGTTAADEIITWTSGGVLVGIAVALAGVCLWWGTRALLRPGTAARGGHLAGRFVLAVLLAPYVFFTNLRYFFISVRYLSKRLICLLSILMIGGGVMVLVIVYGVMTGFQKEVRERIRGTMSHVIIELSLPPEAGERVGSRSWSTRMVELAERRQQFQRRLAEVRNEVDRAPQPPEADGAARALLAERQKMLENEMARADQEFVEERRRHQDRLMDMTCGAVVERLFQEQARRPAPARLLAGASVRVQGFAASLSGDQSNPTVHEVNGIDPAREDGVSEFFRYRLAGRLEYVKMIYEGHLTAAGLLLRLCPAEVGEPMEEALQAGSAGNARAADVPLLSYLMTWNRDLVRRYVERVENCQSLREVRAVLEDFRRDWPREWSAAPLPPAAEPFRPAVDRAFALYRRHVLDDGGVVRAALARDAGDTGGLLPAPANVRKDLGVAEPLYRTVGEMLATFDADAARYEAAVERLFAAGPTPVDFNPAPRADPEAHACVVGAEFYRRWLRRRLGDTPPEARLVNTLSLSTLRPRGERGLSDVSADFEIVDLVRTGMFEADMKSIYLSLEAAREFLFVPESRHSVNVKLTDVDRTDEAVAWMRPYVKSAIDDLLAWSSDYFLALRDYDLALRGSDQAADAGGAGAGAREPAAAGAAARVKAAHAAWARRFAPLLRDAVWRDGVLAAMLEADARLDARQPVERAAPLFPPARAQVADWQKARANLLKAVDVERGLVVIIIGILMIFTGLAIAIIILLMVVDKTRDIGILSALGADGHGVMAVFLYNGVFIGAAGAILGVLAGLFVTTNLNAIAQWIETLTGWYPFPKEIYYLDRIPTDRDPWHIAAIGGFAMSICFLWSIIPAFIASIKEPLDALQYE